MDPKVNLFLVGAAKAGTTALAQLLSQQSNVFSPTLKEPCHFGSDIDPSQFSKNYASRVTLPQGYFNTPKRESLHMAFVKDPKNYQKLYEGSDSFEYRLDASTVYLSSQKASEEIAQYNPFAKVLIILRDPAQRAYSHYLMGVQMGLISTSFEEAWEQDLLKTPKGIGQSEMLSELGLYAESIKRYLSVFPREQICFLLHEEFSLMTHGFSESLGGFLKMPLDFSEVTRENTSVETKYKKVNKWIKGNAMLQSVKDKMAPQVVGRVKKWMTQDVSPLSSEMRAHLTEFYQDDIIETEALTGFDLTKWKK